VNDLVEARVSEPDGSYRWDLRISLVVAALGFLGAQWLLFIKGPGKGDSLFDGVLLELLACAVFGFVLLLWRNRKRHAIGFDTDGLWLLHLGKQRGLVPWDKIASIRENGLWCRMSLRGRGGEKLIDVEYQRAHFQLLRNLIMDRMSFRPPTLPSVFPSAVATRVLVAAMAVMCGGFGLLFIMNPTHESGPIFTVSQFVSGPFLVVGALIMAASAIRPAKGLIERDCVRLGRRRYPYSDIESVSMSFWGMRGQMYPRVSMNLRGHEGKPVLLPHGGDSLTFQRTLQWALDRWRDENAGSGAR
jgi:hypothetical protein